LNEALEIVGKEKATKGVGGLESEGNDASSGKKTRCHPTTGLANGALIYIKNSKAAGRRGC
jgi:hypothetical protein